MARPWFEAFFDAAYVQLLRAQMPPATTRAQVDFVVRQLCLGSGARVLDLACGFGRHAIALAKRGYQVVGLDLSPAMLAQARRDGRGVRGLDFVRGDMRRLPFSEEFDAVVNLFTSFGYFSDRDNLRALNAMARALRPGGRLLIDSRDRAYDTAMHAKQDNHYRLWWPVGHDRRVLEEIDYDPKRGRSRVHWTMLRRAGKLWRGVEKDFELRVYSVAEWRRMLWACGLAPVAMFGGFDARTRGRPGARLIVVAEKS